MTATVHPATERRAAVTAAVDQLEPGSAKGVAFALALREGRLLVGQPAFVAGIVLTLLLFRVTGGESTDWRDFSTNVVLVTVPLGWLTLVAANLGALRARRHGTAELFDTLPADPSVRTAAHCLATVATLPVTVALLAIDTAIVATLSETSGRLLPVEMALALPIVAGGGVVGVAVARWLPRSIVAVLAIFVIIQIEVWLGDSLTSRWRWLSFWVDPAHTGLDALDIRPSGWHLVWVTAWVLIMAVVAVARHGLRRAGALTLAGAVVVAGVAGWAQTRPLPEHQARHLASMLMHPERHQVCERHGSVTYCAYEEHIDLVPEWRRQVEAVLAAVPDDGRALRVTQRAASVVGSPDCGAMDYLDAVPPEVARRVDRAELWRADGDVHPPLLREERLSCGGADLEWLYTAVQTGAWAVGLPPAPHGDDRRCIADGQARAALALWLGARVVPESRHRLLLATDAPRDRDGRLDYAGAENPDGWSDPPQWGVRWHAGDVSAALALLDQPADQVAAVVAQHWSVLTDPATPTGALLDLVGARGGGGGGVAAGSGDCPDLRTA